MLKISNLLSSLKNFNKFNKNLFHTSLSVNGTQYYPINDEVFGLNEEGLLDLVGFFNSN